MAYTVTNFKKKIDLKRAIESGARISVFQPGPFGPNVPDGRCVLEGPHYPAAHTWYASCMVKDGYIVGKVK